MRKHFSRSAFIALLSGTAFFAADPVEAQTRYEGTLVFSTANAATIESVDPDFSYDPEDIPMYAFTFDMEVGGNLVGLSADFFFEAPDSSLQDLNGLSIDSPSSDSGYLLPGDATTLGGVDYEDSQIVQFNTMSATTSLLWDAEDDGGGTSVVLDALHVVSPTSFYISTENNEEIYGTDVLNGDVALIDPVANTATIVYSESIHNSPDNLNGFSINPITGNFLLTFDGITPFPGIGNVDDGDIVEWNGISGAGASGILVFDESDGHFALTEDLDAIGYFNPTTIPEPSAAFLFLISSCSLVWLRRRS